MDGRVYSIIQRRFRQTLKAGSSGLLQPGRVVEGGSDYALDGDGVALLLISLRYDCVMIYVCWWVQQRDVEWRLLART